MSAKRSRMEIASDSEGSDDDVGMEIDQLGNVNVNMELKGLSIEEEDFSGIKQLLCPLLPKSNVNVSGLTDDIIGQNFIGHIIKQVDERSEEANEEDPVLSISTIVPLNEQSWVKDLSTFCKKKAETLKGDSKAVSDFFAGKTRAEGLVSLLEDVKNAQKKKHKSTWEWDF